MDQADQFRRGAVVGGRYEVTAAIGRGAFGQVYEARHLATGHNVALKVLRPRSAVVTDAMRQEFFAEASVTAGLCHPNTVRVFDFGETDGGALYLTMERLIGETLQHTLARLKRQQRPLGDSASRAIARAVLGSLAEAHAVGLVHQDLKPTNIFLQRIAGGQFVCKVLDFGLAVRVSEESNASTHAAGTPQYMSPEQACGQPVDGRSDLYSFGLVLFECLTGNSPYVANTPREFLGA